jgi:hypothetical protein
VLVQPTQNGRHSDLERLTAHANALSFVLPPPSAIKWTERQGRNGKPITVEGMDVIRCNDAAKVVSIRAYWDPGPTAATIQI